MLVKNIVDEDFVNFKKPSMFIATCYCDWKCCTEQGLDITVCQNSQIAQQPNIRINDDVLIDRYISNPITQAIVIGGLEPFKQYEELYLFITHLRQRCDDTVVIYTGYEYNEIFTKIACFQSIFSNIIVKFGRYIPNHQPHYDKVLGVYLSSDNQKGVQIC